MKLKKKYLHSLLLPIMTFLGLFLHHHSLAYQFTDDLLKGSFWRTFPLPLKIQMSSSDSRYEVTENALIEAIEEWQRHSSIQLWDYQDSSSISRVSNVIRWSNDFQKETGYSVNSTMAVTIRYSTPPLLQRTEIIINGQYPGLADLDNLRKILIHELGHTIGLDHSDYYGSMMYSTLSLNESGPNDLSHDDIDGLHNVVSYHTQKQSEPIQLEQRQSGSKNALDGFSSCGQNNQDVLSFSAAENTHHMNTFLVWLFSLTMGIFVTLTISLIIQRMQKFFL